MTKAERAQTPRIRFELAQQGITSQRWAFQALARGAFVIYDEKNCLIRFLLNARGLSG